MATPISEITLKLNNREYIYALKEADRETKKLGDTIEDTSRRATTANNRMESSVGNLSAGFGRLRGALVGLGIGAFVADTIRAGDSIVDLSRAVDVSVASIMEFRLALQQSGGEAKDADKIIVEFLKSINEFAQGNDAAVEAFRKLGIGAKELQTLTPEEVFRKAVEGLDRIADSSEQAAIKQQIFSKAMNSVSAEDFNEALKKLRGTQDGNAQSQIAMAQAMGQAEEVFNRLQIAVAKAIKPLLDFFEKTGDWSVQTDKLAKTLQVLAAAFVALYAADKVRAGINALIDGGKALLAISKARFATEVAIQALGEGVKGGTKGATRGPKGAAIGGVVAGIGAVITAKEIYDAVTEMFGGVGIRDIMPGTSEAGAGRGFINPPLVGGGGTTASGRPALTGAITPPKELTSQLAAVESIADAYKRASENARQKLILDAESLTLTEEEAAKRRGLADIQNKLNDALGKLDEKRKGAKGETLALIAKEEANIKRTAEAEKQQFLITNERVFAKKREELVTKALLEQEEIRLQYAQEMAAYQDQINRSIVQAFEQTKQIKEQLDLTTEQEKLERSIRNMRGEDQKYTRDIFNLEVERKRNLEAIARIPDLPYQERLKKEEEINAAYNERKNNLEKMYVQDKVNQNSFVYGWNDALERWRNNLKTDSERAAEVFQTLTTGFEDAIVRFVQTGKLSFRDLFNSLIAQATRIAANNLLMSIFGGMFGGGTGGNFLTSLFGGFRAAGGPVNPGKAYVVGEKGPELFVPRTPGGIVPNGADMGGGSGGVTQITYNIQAVDASSFRQLVARDPEFIFNVTEQGRRSLPTRSRR